MILTNNNHRFMILKDELLNIVDVKNKLIFGKYPFNFAEHDDNILVVSDSIYKHIMIDIGDII